MKKYIQLLTALLLLTACNPNTPSALSVRGKIYKHPTAVQYLKFKTDSVQDYSDFDNEALSNHTFAYTQKDEVVTVYTPTPEHLLAYEGFVLRNGQQYELLADTSDPNYQDHQPQDPKAFSLVGKRYMSSANEQEQWVADTLEFVTLGMALYYAHPKFSLHYSYELDFPQIVIGGYLGIFNDTTALLWRGHNYEIIK